MSKTTDPKRRKRTMKKMTPKERKKVIAEMRRTFRNVQTAQKGATSALEDLKPDNTR